MSSQFDPDWTYTFIDAVSGAELGTFPLTGVTFEKVLNGAGKMDATLPTVDASIRAMDPWTATVPRRTLVTVDYLGHLLWCGMVWSRTRSQDKPGIVFTAATLDTWMATLLPLNDGSWSQGGGESGLAVEAIYWTLHALQNQPGGRLGPGVTVADFNEAWAGGGNPNWFGNDPDPAYLQLQGWYPDPIPADAPSYGRTGPVHEQRPTYATVWPRTDLKDALTRMGEFLAKTTPIEWRFDHFRNADGSLAHVLLVGDGRIGRTTDVTGLHADYPGTLLTWTDVEDGTVEGNAAVGSMTDPANSANKLWSYWTAGQVGGAVEDEIAEGFPLMMRPVTTSGAGITGQGTLDVAVQAEVADALTAGNTLSNVTLRLDWPQVWTYDVGDDFDLTMTHPGYPEFPAEHDAAVRILGKKVTVRGPGQPDSVSLTVFSSDSGRLPRSTTLVAHMRSLQRRIRALEQS